jgi:TatD DNase family protein
MLIDSHCHLDRLNLTAYNGDLSAALSAARDRGVGKFLCIGISHHNFNQIIDIAKQHTDIYATAGLHPLEFNESGCLKSVEIRQWLMNMALDPLVVGIGETGLDYHYSKESVQAQQLSFAIHLEVARELSKPVIVHTRDARKDTLDLIRTHGCLESAGVLHCFTESWEMAKAALDLNYYISFSGIITFKNASELRDIVKRVPLDRLLVETDSPYLAPVPYRGRPNEPKNVLEVAQCVADLKGLGFDAICEQTSRNFSSLFNIRF